MRDLRGEIAHVISFRTRILAVVVITLLPAAVLAIVTARSFDRLSEASDLLRRSFEVLGRARDIDRALLQAHVLSYREQADGQTQSLAAREAASAVERGLHELETLVSSDQAYQQLVMVRVMYSGFRVTAAQALQAEGRGGVEAARVLWLQVRQAILAVRAELDHFIEIQNALLADSAQADEATARRVRTLLVLGGVVGLGGGVGAALLLSGRLIRPIESLTQAVDRVAAGDMSQQVAVGTTVEVGRLATGFNAMVARVKEREEQLDRARREAEQLVAVARVVGGTFDLQEALRLICRELGRLTGAETVSAYVQDVQQDALRPVAAWHVPKEALAVLATATLPLSAQGFRDEALRDGRAVWSDDVPSDPRFAFAVFRQFPHQSSLIVPLVFDGAVAGAFYLVWWRERRRFAEDELAVLRTVGQQVGILLRSARLYEDVARERDRLATLNTLSRRLAAAHDTDEILSLIVNETSRLVNAEAVALWMLEGDEFVLRARTEAAEPLTRRTRVRAFDSMSGAIAGAGEPVAVEDLATDERFPAVQTGPPARLGFRGFLGVPLRASGDVLGTLSVYSQTPRRFIADEIHLLSLVADQAALAIEKGRLLREAVEGWRVLEQLYRIGITMQASRDRDNRLKAFVRGAHEVMGFDRVYVLLTTPDGAGLELTRVHGIDDDGPSVTLPLTYVAGPFFEAFRSRRPVTVLSDDDLARAPKLDAEWVHHPYFRTRRFIVVPLMVGDRVIGVAAADNKASRRPIPSTSVEPFTLLCQQLAGVLESAHAYAESEERRREAEVMARLMRDVSSTLEIDAVLRRVAEAARELCGADVTRIALREGDSDRVTLLGSAGELHAEDRDLVIEPGKGVGGQVLLTGRPFRTDDYAGDPRVSKHYRDAALAGGIVAVMAVPIRIADRVEGLLFADNRRPAPFTDRDEAILTRLADQVSVAIQNARLYEEAQRRRREAEVMAELSREISGSLDLDSVLLRVAHGVRELCGSDMSMIALREPGSGAMVVRYRVAANPDSYVGRRIEPGKGVGGQVLLTGRPFRCENILEDPRVTRDYMRWDAQQASVASMAVPIRIGGDTEGLLYAQHRAPRRWTDHDEAIVARLADHAVIAIQNARLFAREQEARAEAERAATALGASEEQYRALAEGSIQGMYIHQDMRIVFANRSMARILGYDGPDELVGQHYLTVIAPGEHARIEGYRQARLAGGEAPTRYEAEGVRRDGSQIWIEIVVSVVPWAGRPAVLGTFLDITERKRAEEALRRSEQENARLFQQAEHDKTLLEQVFASTSDGILVLSLEGRVTALNRRGGELLGLMPDEAVGRPFARLAEQLGRAVDWSAAGGRALLELVQARVRSGAGDLEMRQPELQTLEWQATLRRDTMGNLVGLTFTFRDVTREREVGRMKSDFVSFVTHQLRTPLAGIKWMLELARQEHGLPEEARACVQDAQEANERLIGLVNDLLDVSRLEGGRFSLALAEVSLGELTLDVAGELAPLVKDKGHRLTVDGADAVRPVVGDPQLLRQVVLNLIANALKYTPPGGEIAVSLRDDDGQILWAVRDTGIGIPKESQRRLFEKFYRADNAITLETEGTGLGLHLVKLIVERFGGRIWCESEEGQGAAFFVALPARR